MDSELDLLLGTAIDNLLKLEILLFLHARPGSVLRPEEIAQRVRRSEPEVAQALNGLAEAGLIERFTLGTGRHAVYGPSEDDHVRRIIEVLHERFNRDPETRGRLVRSALRVSSEDVSPLDTS
jgi:DNA-binding Lrp family transcriptional regulator